MKSEVGRMWHPPPSYLTLETSNLRLRRCPTNLTWCRKERTSSTPQVESTPHRRFTRVSLLDWREKVKEIGSPCRRVQRSLPHGPQPGRPAHLYGMHPVFRQNHRQEFPATNSARQSQSRERITFMSLRGAQRRSNLNPWHGRLLRFARNDIPGGAVEHPRSSRGNPALTAGLGRA